jgi:hypothetical protein
MNAQGRTVVRIGRVAAARCAGRLYAAAFTRAAPRATDKPARSDRFRTLLPLRPVRCSLGERSAEEVLGWAFMCVTLSRRLAFRFRAAGGWMSSVLMKVC